MKKTLFVIFLAVLFLGPTTLFAQDWPIEYERAGYYQMKEVAPGVQKLIRTEGRVYIYYPNGWEMAEEDEVICGALMQYYHISFRSPSGDEMGVSFRIFPRDEEIILFERPKAVFPKKRIAPRSAP